MKVLLPQGIERRLIAALKEADNREIGGILMGEYVADDVYRVCDLTIQRLGGTLASFMRVVREILAPLRRFFHRTGYNFTQFNYLGEWHSHPSFAPYPSGIDAETMWEIVDSPQVGANFAILMVVQLNNTDCLEGTVTVYVPGRRTLEGELAREDAMT
jgi:hypothetical protein